MTLAYLANFFPSLTETFIYREVLELKRREINVEIYSLRKPNYSDISKEAISLYKDTFYLLPLALPCLFKCHLKFLFRTPVRYVMTLWKMLVGTHKRFKDRVRSLMHFGEGVVLADKMLNDGISHIHSHYASQSCSVARVVHLLTRISYSFTAHAHDIWHDQLLLPEKLDEALFITCCSEFGRQWIIKQGSPQNGIKVHVVYHGLDVRKYGLPECEENREKNLVLSVGRLTPQKGFPDLITACRILRKQNFDFRCLIVGEGEQMEELETHVKLNGLNGRVKLIGAVPQESMKEYYHRAWVFALPCVDTIDGNRDGIPNVLMEAMATGLPVITTTNSGQSELIENETHGILISSHSPVELASAIRRLCEDYYLREQIRIQARERMVNEFDSEKTIEPLLKLFKEFVFKKRAWSTARFSP